MKSLLENDIETRLLYSNMSNWIEVTTAENQMKNAEYRQKYGFTIENCHNHNVVVVKPIDENEMAEATNIDNKEKGIEEILSNSNSVEVNCASIDEELEIISSNKETKANDNKENPISETEIQINELANTIDKLIEEANAKDNNRKNIMLKM